MRDTMQFQRESTHNTSLSKPKAKSSARPTAALQRIAGNQALNTASASQAATVWIEAKPVAIEDGPRSGIRDINLGLVDLGDDIYVYHVPSPSYKTENVDQGSIETRTLSKNAGDSIDGTEIRITVGYQQRNFGKLPKLWYEKGPNQG